jgi:glycosyltransferase involved in cell wall biosynthesis
MIEGNDIICFCNDWDGDPLSKKQIVSRLAKRNRILWINSTGNRNPTVSARDLRRAWKKVRQFCRGCRQVSDNISLFTPLVIPFHGNRAARWINRLVFTFSLRRVCRRLGFRNPITLTFVPSSAGVAGSLGERLVVYYCVDEYSQFSGANAKAILELERRLLARSGLVIVSASGLLERKRLHNPNTFLITHGVDADHFRKACWPETAIPDDCPKGLGPVIGFFGLIEDWVDLGLIRELAVARPGWSFVLIGEVRADACALRGLPNVHLLGRRTYQSLPGYCRAFDIAILPFVVNELTLAANPLKLREYLAAGLPVVASPLPEIRKLGSLVYLASTAPEYLARIDTLLAAGTRGPDLATSLRMDAESWDEKVDELSRYIARAETGGPADAQPAAASLVA